MSDKEPVAAQQNATVPGVFVSAIDPMNGLWYCYLIVSYDSNTGTATWIGCSARDKLHIYSVKSAYWNPITFKNSTKELLLLP